MLENRRKNVYPRQGFSPPFTFHNGGEGKEKGDKEVLLRRMKKGVLLERRGRKEGEDAVKRGQGNIAVGKKGKKKIREQRAGLERQQTRPLLLPGFSPLPPLQKKKTPRSLV